MDKIQVAAAAEEQPMAVIDEMGDIFIPADEPQKPEEEVSAAAEDIPPVSPTPKMKVEVVIDRKPQCPVEEPILPDHYYDDGNVPVFKPVCSWSHPTCDLLS